MTVYVKSIAFTTFNSIYLYKTNKLPRTKLRQNTRTESTFTLKKQIT